MNIHSKLEIHFHKQDEVSIVLENNTSGREERFGEILFFCLFALRTMVNFGYNPTSYSLAYMLTKVKNRLIMLTKQKEVDDPSLIDYPGYPGKKQFIAELALLEDNPKFQYFAKGFGFLARGIGYYAPNSVTTLIKYLALRRIGDYEFIGALEDSAYQCGELFGMKKITLTNQSIMALAITEKYYKIENKNQIYS